MPVVVHTMGKVGSVSVVNMLLQKNVRSTHLHYGMFPEGEYHTASQLQFGAAIHRDDDNWRVITLVRKPIWRNLSAFFHSLKKYYSLDYYKLDAIKNNFLYNYNHAAPEDWFEKDFKQLYRTDILSLPFDPKSGYAIYKVRPGLEILLLRMEDLNRVAPVALKEFMGLSGIEPVHKNATRKRTDWYNRTKKLLTFPQSFIDYVNGFAWARHYYTKDELEEDYKYLEPEKEPEWDPRPL